MFVGTGHGLPAQVKVKGWNCPLKQDRVPVTPLDKTLKRWSLADWHFLFFLLDS